MTDEIEEGKWVWIDECPLSGHFTNWAPNEPTNSNNMEDCAVLNSHWKPGDAWTDINCANQYNYVCELGPDLQNCFSPASATASCKGGYCCGETGAPSACIACNSGGSCADCTSGNTLLQNQCQPSVTYDTGGAASKCTCLLKIQHYRSSIISLHKRLSFHIKLAHQLAQH